MLKEQYYTDPKIAKQLIKIFNKVVNLNKFDLIIEPSAGTGSFIKNLPTKKSRKVMAFDIAPRTKGVKKQNFLTWRYNGKVSRKKILCIGNPPYGLNSKLAKQISKNNL